MTIACGRNLKVLRNACGRSRAADAAARNCDNPVTIVDKGDNSLILWSVLHGRRGAVLTLC